MKKILFAVALSLAAVAAHASADSGTRFLSDLADKQVLTMNNHLLKQVDSSGCIVTFYWGERSWVELDFSDVAAIENINNNVIVVHGPVNGHHEVPYIDSNTWKDSSESERFSISKLGFRSSVGSFVPDIERAVRSIASDCGAKVPHFTE